MTPTLSDERLRECPFCGGTNIDPLGWASAESAGPACDDCGASCGDISHTPEQNAAAWNRRTQPSAGEVVAYRVRHKGDERWALTFTDPRVTPSGAVNDEIKAEPLYLSGQSPETSGLISPSPSRGIAGSFGKGGEASATPPDQSRVERLEALPEHPDAETLVIMDEAYRACSAGRGSYSGLDGQTVVYRALRKHLLEALHGDRS
jgi:hypothetical protein